jgi:glycosyltransferase involved in cell wall biosynthesis
MKVAIVHDCLTELGGAERVLAEFLNLFPKAKVFTSHYRKDVVRTRPTTLNANNLIVSWYQNFPRKTTATIQLLAPLIWRFKELKKNDLTITSSAYCLSPISTLSSSPVIHYIHSIPKNLFGLEEPTFFQKKLPFSFQKNLYLQSLKNSNYIIANSQNTQNIIKKIVGIDSKVIYPPVLIPRKPPSFVGKKEYFLIISRIDSNKSIEIAIQACTQLNLPLKIAGVANCPRYLYELKKMAGKNIEFLNFVSEKERIKLYQKAIAFLFCSKNEDFGIAPVEAMANGVPVIAYRGGGVKETVVDGKTGLFFRHHSWQSMAEAIKKFNRKGFNRKNLYNQAKKFSRERFRKEFMDFLKNQLNFTNFDNCGINTNSLKMKR